MLCQSYEKCDFKIKLAQPKKSVWPAEQMKSWKAEKMKSLLFLYIGVWCILGKLLIYEYKYYIEGNNPMKRNSLSSVTYRPKLAYTT